MEQPSTFSFSYGMKRWWKGGGGVMERVVERVVQRQIGKKKRLENRGAPSSP